MKISISYFQNIRHFQPNQIPVSTSVKWPFWIWSGTGINIGDYFVDKNNVMNGIIEDALCFPTSTYENLSQQCSKGCSYFSETVPCQFMKTFHDYLETVDFEYVIHDLRRISEDVRKITHYIGEPEIVLMVYEHPRVKCAERPVIRKWFENNGYQLPEWKDESQVF